jgi:hypothetical protein
MAFLKKKFPNILFRNENYCWHWASLCIMLGLQVVALCNRPRPRAIASRGKYLIIPFAAPRTGPARSAKSIPPCGI